MHAISVDRLTKRFGTTTAVDNVSFSVEQGELFGFLGPNGAGKTTTIRCLLDFLRPTDGTIKILGLDAQAESVAIRRKVRYVGSGEHLYGHWTGWDHIRFAESFYGKAKNASDVANALNFNPSLKVRTLSFGTKQKLALLLALIGEPKLLILDEPTIGLDPLLQHAVYELLKARANDGATVFFSSHNLPEVEKLCSRAAIIKAGKLVAIESIRALHDKKLYTVEATFRDPIDAKKFVAKNVTLIDSTPHGFTLRVQGEVAPTLALLGKAKLRDVSVTHADLEATFMDFYR